MLQSRFKIGPLHIQVNVIDDDIVTAVYVGTEPSDMHEITGFKNPFDAAVFVQNLQAWSDIPGICDARITHANEIKITIEVKKHEKNIP